jgi:Fe2+ or Zn2+ uptake regulation protein
MPSSDLRASPDLGEILRGRGQRVTPQRVVIHDTLRQLGRHVTAEELLGAVCDRLPNVSAPTVYATLELFEELGLVRRIERPGAALYDPRTDEHHHRICAACGRIEDLDADVDTSAAIVRARRDGFRASRAEVTVSGLCAPCARQDRQASVAMCSRNSG